MPPCARQRSTDAANKCCASLSPKNWRSLSRGIANRNARGAAAIDQSKRVAAARDSGSAGSCAVSAEATRQASSTVSAKIDTQSSERQAGTTPWALKRPPLGLRPTRLLNAAGTRPEPAVSVPSAKLASPAATATAEPELDPPLM